MSPGVQGNFCSKSAAIFDDEPSRTTTNFVKPQDLGSANSLALWLSARMQRSLSAWGIEPGTKNITNLWIGILEGETTLEDSYPPKRTINVACVNIRNPRGCVLVEPYQELGDGSVRVRNRLLAEKMKAEESVEAAWLRGVKEELGFVLCEKSDEVEVEVGLMMESYRREVKERDAESYPGLMTCYVVHYVDAVVRGLPESDFFTEEDEEGRINGGGNDSCERRAIGVTRHFWEL